jgi:glutamate dehydrogenase
MNKDMPQDPRTQTLALVNENKPGDASPEAATLIAAWIAALDDEDLTGIDPHALSGILWDAFPQVVRRTEAGCRIAQVRHGDGRRGMATALLILNDDMPYLVDSFVMALRRRRVAS